MQKNVQTASTRTVRGREKIITEIRNVLRKNGASNHLVSSLIWTAENELVDEFNKTHSEKLGQLVSHPITPKGKKWVASYKIAMQFLLNNHMHNTLHCIDKEMQQSFGLTSEKILLHGQQKYRKLMKCSTTSFFKKTVANHMKVVRENRSESSSVTSLEAESIIGEDLNDFPDRNYFPLFDPFNGI